MSGIHTGWTGPPRSAPSYDILTAQDSHTMTSRWTRHMCNLVPDGQLFYQHDSRDRELYLQAGCTHMGTRSFRPDLFLTMSHATLPTYEATLLNTWCCQPHQVVDAFNAYVQTDEYRRSQKMVFVYAALTVIGVALVIINRKKLGFKLRHQHGDFLEANPYEKDTWDEDDAD